MSKRGSSAVSSDSKDGKRKARKDGEARNGAPFENESYQYFRDDHRIVIKSGVEEVCWSTVRPFHQDTARYIEFGKDVKLVCHLACVDCIELQEVTLGKRVEKIDDKAFQACVYIKRINFNEALESIGEMAFARCYRLQEVLLGETAVTEIHSGAFSNCRALTRVEFNESLECISSIAFKECPLLQELVLGENVKNIGHSCFGMCTQLKTVICNDNLESIGDGAFQGCEELEHVFLARGLKSLGRGCFRGCPATLRITYTGVNLPVALRLSCEIPDAVPELSFDRLVVMFFAKPIGKDDMSYFFWDSFGQVFHRGETRKARLARIQEACPGKVRNVLLWMVGQGVYNR